MSQRKHISDFELLLIANQIIQDHDDYVEGMRATAVEERDDVLIFKGEYFLNDGMPSEKTPAAFNMFKYLAHHLSKEFTIK